MHAETRSTVAVTHHAVRRYAERADLFPWTPPAGMDDRTAVSVLESLGYPVEAVRSRIAAMAAIGVLYGANAVSVSKVNLVLAGSVVVTCAPKPYATRRRHGPRPARGTIGGIPAR